MLKKLMGLLRQVFTWTFTAVYVPGIIVICLFASHKKRTIIGPKLVRGWGKTILFNARVRVVRTPRAQAILATREPRVLTFNHSSTLDVPLGASLLPEGGVLVVKDEMRTIPFMGQGLAALGTLFLNRGNREQAYASLEKAGERIGRESLQVLIAPEGTRSQDGNLQPFKRGAFHLSHVSGAPIHPVVLHGCTTVWPMGKFAPIPGTVTIDVLPPMNVTDGSPEGLNAAADRLRGYYADALEAGPNLSA